MENVEVKYYQIADPTELYGDKMAVTASFNTLERLTHNIEGSIIQQIVSVVAERYVAEHYPELVAKLDQQAIANLVIAESGKKIAEEIRLTPGRVQIDNSESHSHFSLF